MRPWLLPIMSLSALLIQASPAVDLPAIVSEPAFPACTFTKPLALVWLPGPGERRLVVEQGGTVRLLAGPAPTSTSLALDVRAQVRTKGNEEGLLHLALHPHFADNGRVFVWCSVSDPRRNQLWELHMDPAGTTIEATPTVLLSIDDPADNHNGGTLCFGADSFLYVSTGDGGGGGDPWNNSQNLGVLLGKVLRIDVDGAKPYAIPSNNPFVGKAGARPEIWAYGLRNVWRMAFDRKTGVLWAGDVGQNMVEEVTLIEKGGNHGWNVKEGFRDFKPRQPADDAPLIAPVYEYPRDRGVSITGGLVYRGKAIPALVGWYVYGDFASGRVWALKRRPDGTVDNRELLHQPHRMISSFAEDPAGEIYYTAFDGRIYRLVAGR